MPPVVLLLPAVVAIAFSGFMLVWKLDWIGFTWDEYVDFFIVGPIAANLREVLFMDMDPTQGRLNHLIAAPFIRLFGHNLFVFKIVFVGIGIVAAIALFLLLARLVSRTTALALTAVFVSSPYFLSAARSSATSGDILTVLMTILFIGALGRWIVRRDHGCRDRVSPVLCGVVCGLAIGAKLTNGLWVPLALIVVGNRAGWKASFVDFARFLPVCALAAVLAHPLFLRGPVHFAASMAQAYGFEPGSYLYLGHFVHRPPWYFPLAVLLAKIGPLAFLFALWVVAALLWKWFRGEEVDPLLGVALAVVYLDYLLVARRFQNAQYYLPAFTALFVLCAGPLESLLREARPWRRRTAGAGVVLTLALQAAVNWDLSPDFGQAGRHYGEFMQGQMAGPAINHCQGGPITIAELNALQEIRHFPAAYVYENCGPIINQDQVSGPIRATLPLPDNPLDNPPPRPHWVLVSRVFDYGYLTAQDLAFRAARKDRLLRGCEMVSRRPDGPYRIYACP